MSASQTWVDLLKKALTYIISEGVDEWSSIVEDLGLPTDFITEWSESFQSTIRTTLEELIEQLDEKRTALRENIDKLYKKREKYENELGKKLSPLERNGSGLYELHEKLNCQVDELESHWNDRMKYVESLMNDQNNLCKALERKQLISSLDSHLPSASQIADLEHFVKSLDDEKFELTEKYTDLKCECIEMCKNFSIDHNTTFENKVINTDEGFNAVTKKNFRSLQKFHEELKVKSEKLKKDICAEKKELENLWTYLEIGDDYRADFLEKNKGLNKKVLENYKRECRKCRNNLKENMEGYVENMRLEIFKLWRLCYYSEEEKSNFPIITGQEVNEELLKLVQYELRKLKEFYSENENLCKSIETRMELWSQMLELEEKESDPKRLNNRGGQLLLDEKNKKSVVKKILKIEEKILKLAGDYEKKKGKKFTYFGDPIETYISETHRTHEENKKLRSSAKTRLHVLTPSNTRLRTQTPQMSQTKVKSSYLSIANMSKMHSCKSSLFIEKSKSTTKKLEIPRVKKSGIVKPKTSLSAGKSKKDTLRKVSKLIKENYNLEGVEYHDFKVKVPARSSTVFDQPSPLAMRLPKSPLPPSLF